jgi:hypothetical protein
LNKTNSINSAAKALNVSLTRLSNLINSKSEALSVVLIPFDVDVGWGEVIADCFSTTDAVTTTGAPFFFFDMIKTLNQLFMGRYLHSAVK